MRLRPSDMPVTMWNGFAWRTFMIADFSNEKDENAGYWIYLKPGFVDKGTEMHLIHEDTVKEVVRAMRRAVQCECDDCKREMAQCARMNRWGVE